MKRSKDEAYKELLDLFQEPPPVYWEAIRSEIKRLKDQQKPFRVHCISLARELLPGLSLVEAKNLVEKVEKEVFWQ